MRCGTYSYERKLNPCTVAEAASFTILRAKDKGGWTVFV